MVHLRYHENVKRSATSIIDMMSAGLVSSAGMGPLIGRNEPATLRRRAAPTRVYRRHTARHSFAPLNGISAGADPERRKGRAWRRKIPPIDPISRARSRGSEAFTGIARTCFAALGEET
jgi:hypothetical protein